MMRYDKQKPTCEMGGHSGSDAQKRPNIVSKETYYSVKPARWRGHSGSEARGLGFRVQGTTPGTWPGHSGGEV
jgi:hypothetical protein